MSPGTEDGNGDGRGAIGVTAGAVAIGAGAIGRGLDAARGGSVVFATALGAGADLALGFATLRAGFFAAARLTLALTFLALAFLVFTFRRAGAAFALRLAVFFFVLLAFALRFFAMSLSQSLVK